MVSFTSWVRRRPVWAGALLAVAVSGCELDINEVRYVTPDQASVDGLYYGALADFQTAYSGAGDDSFLSVSALMSDELYSSDTFTTRNATDRRDQQPPGSGNTSDAAYNRLQLARNNASNAAEKLRAAKPNDPRIAELKALEGLAIVALAEGWCGAVPLGRARDGVPVDTGRPLSTAELFQRAVALFDSALAVNPNSNLAKVGKGRALLNLGQFQQAAAAVSGVPTTFVYFIQHSDNTSRQYNPIFALQSNRRYTMSDREGTNGLDFRSSGDPRTPWIRPSGTPGIGFDNVTPVYLILRYPTYGADVPVADGIEARLIEAEAALQRGDNATWLAILNQLRADVRNLMAARYQNYTSYVPGPNNPSTTLPPLTDPGTPQGRVDLMFRERAFWLFATGHRLGDLRRLIRQYGRTQAQVFPVGTHKTGPYGTDVNFQIPFNEIQNPYFKPELCNTKQA